MSESIVSRLLNSIRDYFNITNVQILNCTELTVLPTSSFYPVNAVNINQLWSDRTDAEWEEKFQESYMVHFYGAQTSGWSVTSNTRNTAYQYLAPRYCPDTFNLAEIF